MFRALSSYKLLLQKRGFVIEAVNCLNDCKTVLEGINKKTEKKYVSFNMFGIVRERDHFRFYFFTLFFQDCCL